MSHLKVRYRLSKRFNHVDNDREHAVLKILLSYEPVLAVHCAEVPPHILDGSVAEFRRYLSSGLEEKYLKLKTGTKSVDEWTRMTLRQTFL